MQARKWLTRGVLGFLIIFLAAAPHSIAAAQIAYAGAVLLCLINWILGYWRPVPQPLVLPSLLFLVLSAVSAALSFVPSLSWGHLKSVALLLVFVLIAQSLQSFSELKTLSLVLIVSCLINVIYTGWQYSEGIGVKLVGVNAESALRDAGLASGDVIKSVNAHAIRDPRALLPAIESLGSARSVRLSVVRGEPLQRIRTEVSTAVLKRLGEEVARGHVLLARGHPIRAQGFYDHFVTYADVLVQIGLLAFGLFLACPAADYRKRILLGITVLAFGCALWLTLTRAAMASFLLGCLLAVWLVCGWRRSLWVLPLIAAAVIGGSILVREGRGLTWLDLKSPEAQYRLWMWKDGATLIRKYPFFGVGMDSIKLEWRQWDIKAYEQFPLRGHFHSTPIQIAVERGLLTLAAWVWLLAEYFRVLADTLKRARHSNWFAHGLAVGFVTATGAFLLGSLVDYSWGDSEVVMIFWAIMGFAIALNRFLSTSHGFSEIRSTGEGN